MEHRALEVDGIRMRWYEHGDGAPVVFLHGIPTCPQLWRYVVPQIRGARALAWELVGYGESIPEGTDLDISVSRQADYLRDWLKALGIDRAVLVGHDLGGGVAQIAAIERPERCAGIVLVNSIAYDAWPMPVMKALRLGGAAFGRLPNALFRRAARAIFRRGHDRRDIADESFELHWENYARFGGGAAMVRQARSLDVRDTLAVVDLLPRLSSIPARIVWGASDPFLHVRYGELLSQDLGAPLTRIESGRHFIPEDHPDEVAQAVNEVVREAAARMRPAAPQPLE